MFIQTEETPNPATLKFMPGLAVLATGSRDYRDGAAAAASPLAKRLFGIGEITGVFLGYDFISVTKSAARDWAQLKPAVLGAIMDHFTSGLPVVDDAAAVVATPGATGTDSALVTQIKELLDHKIRPAVAQDGGDIVFERFEDGIVYLQLHGACSGCPSSSATLKAGVENMLKHYVPEVREVRQANH
jgi:Fe-S cluster biogenesis protein NfuA